MAKEIEEYYKFQEDRRDNSLKELRKAVNLLPEEVEAIHISYDGYGDSGQIEEIRIKDKSGHDVQNEEAAENIMDLCYGILEPGWEINDGSYGTITLHRHSGVVSIEHSERYESVNTYEIEMEF